MHCFVCWSLRDASTGRKFLYDIGNHIYLIYEELGDTEVTITVTDCDDADGVIWRCQQRLGDCQSLALWIVPSVVAVI